MATKSEKKLKRIVAVGCNKGGVGKSVVSRALTDFYRSAAKGVHVYDADGGVGSLVIAYGTKDANGNLLKEQNPAEGVGYYDIRSDASRNTFLDSLASGADIILHDMAGGSLNELKRIVDDGDGVDGLLDAVEAQGYRITFLHVLSNVQGATASVREYLNAFGDRADHVAVVNKAWGKVDEDFPFWNGYEVNGVKKGGKTKDDLLAGGGVELHFPALQPGTFAKVEAGNTPYSAAEGSTELSITERAHLSKFNKTTAAEFLKIKDKLGL
ncbi:hypothetical protein [Agrobacterium tumefaciens]|uniref:hypothetical protein n=1 Tax=Agrobacterium tumefaciens TaxID=358 RepID=UPI0015734BF3|nr:hypothetical protein [Agrobacterium tumefaciens]